MPMYNKNDRQYILKQSSGKVWNFFYSERQGLCYSTLTKRNTWSEPVVLQRNIHNTFFVTIDTDDNFNILFQDAKGNIYYCKIDDKGISTIPILNSRTPIAYDKHLYLIPQKNITHFFYTLVYNDACMLVHQTLQDKRPNSPKVIDYVVKGENPYTAVYDSSGNIYVFYQSSDGKYMQLGYKKYTADQKFWSDFTPITRYKGDCENASAIIDNNNIIHLSYQRRSDKFYELVYQQKTPEKNLWSDEVIIYSSPYTYENSSILYTNDNLYIYWVKDSSIYYSMSIDKGATWSKFSKYNFSTGRQLMCLNYRANSPYQNEKIICKDIPGNFSNGVTLAFYPKASSGSSTSPDDLKNLLLDSLNLLKESVEQLKNSVAKIEDEILSINLAQRSFEKEIVKHSIRLQLLEKNYENFGSLRKFKSATPEPEKENIASAGEATEASEDNAQELPMEVLQDTSEDSNITSSEETAQTPVKATSEGSSKDCSDTKDNSDSGEHSEAKNYSDAKDNSDVKDNSEVKKEAACQGMNKEVAQTNSIER